MKKPAGQDQLIVLALMAITALAFAPVATYPFIRLDDYGYVVDNTHIHEGPTREALTWAWTTSEKANWHPLTCGRTCWTTGSTRPTPAGTT